VSNEPIQVAELPRPPGDSHEQREAEAVMVAALGERLGIELRPRVLTLPDGGRIELDAASDDLTVLCEAWAHQGAAKSAQKHKLLADAFKLTLAARVVGGSPKLFLLLSDEQACKHLRGRSWANAALREFGIELQVVELSDELRTGIKDAQQRPADDAHAVWVVEPAI
jgi:hypothetical protein